MLIAQLVLALHPGPVDQVEQQQSHQSKKQDSQERTHVQHVRNDHVVNFDQALDGRKYLIIGQSEQRCTDQEPRKPGIK